MRSKKPSRLALPPVVVPEVVVIPPVVVIFGLRLGVGVGLGQPTTVNTDTLFES
jgi:hypothetical protein